MPGLLTPQEIRAISDRLVTVVKPDQVILFGSYAKDCATSRSDLDLLLVVPDGSAGRHSPTQLTPYLATSVIRVDLHIATASEWETYRLEPYHFLNSISISGKVLHPTSQSGW
jgi:predicted nucleotidyltransferase